MVVFMLTCCSCSTVIQHSVRRLAPFASYIATFPAWKKIYSLSGQKFPFCMLYPEEPQYTHLDLSPANLQARE